jgi:hypothetical protein
MFKSLLFAIIQSVAILLSALAGYLAILSSHALDFIPILFYRGLAVAFLLGAVVFIAILFLPAIVGKWSPPSAMRFQWAVSSAASVAFFIGFFHILMPVSLDRSISVFMLASIAQSPDGLSKQQIEQRFSDVYITAYDAFGRRIFEQSETGNITMKNGKFVLTQRGTDFIALSRRLVDSADLDRRFVYPDESKSK